MSDTPPVAAKTPLQFALEQISGEDVRQLVVRLAHALVSTCLTQTTIESVQMQRPPEAIAADCAAYAHQLQELEKILGAGFSAVPAPKGRVAWTTVNRLPQTPTP